MEDSNSLYISLGLKERNELWDGFGKEEAIKVLIFNIFTGMVDTLIYLSTTYAGIYDYKKRIIPDKVHVIIRRYRWNSIILCRSKSYSNRGFKNKGKDRYR